MNIKSLSDRLQIIAQEVPLGSKIIDIGTDHGYLPIHLVKENKIQEAIATDVNQGPLQSAAAKINQEQLHHKIETRYGNGLNVTKVKDNIDTVVIAGMGGPLITSILDEGQDPLQTVKKLILQPNVRAKEIRIWLCEHGWFLTNEHILEEDNKFYEILVAEPGNGAQPYSSDQEKREKELLFGPYLSQKQNLAFKKKWEREKIQWQNILANLEKAEMSETVSEKRAALSEKIRRVEEVIHHETS
ncbi:tRNA (adenine-N(1))-methyltransferase [Salibacterium salarium]|uniref:tRNA (Adenine-N(1))-methyltransferase n=1 Tax=Salibacterium salarium TaxID=284579 RepID=A0A428N7Y7_9BACI|nr:tRNA (adenine(22)-N(1))-methyltransferase TrmK [Salibacterium salarium]RSL34496.1 tRNA (adenine-N(1))-methyltransferase [Salibacterium salarium]